MRVRRTLPARERSLIGAWCFVDHYGPHVIGTGLGMDVRPEHVVVGRTETQAHVRPCRRRDAAPPVHDKRRAHKAARGRTAPQTE